ncbi:hypothetical protein QTI33_09140 [Variovorax sp. J22P271]|uniref:hypothetical protein n=1 Tax=Variovorax davisae TaxID=3053515 RepID=UPI002577EAB8|nr:hypothetical protein [Variovorax sp. J22P271]MDM0032292.1 hypothetical protein [Variovorax sp. J22P271]
MRTSSAVRVDQQVCSLAFVAQNAFGPEHDQGRQRLPFASTAPLGGLARGDSLSGSLSLGWDEGKKWGETGVKIGASAVLAPAAAARFGASKEGIGVASQMLRTGAAAGTTNLGVEAGSRAIFHQQLLSPGEAGIAFGGGVLGGAGSPLTNKLADPVLRGGVHMGWGGVTSGGLTYLETGSADQAWQSAGLGAASSLSLGKLEPNRQTLDSAYRSGQQLRSSVNSATRSAGNTLKAAMLGVKLSGAVPDISGAPNPGTWGRPTLGLSVAAGPSKSAISPEPTPDVEPSAPRRTQVHGRIAGEEIWAEISSELGGSSAARSTQPGIRGAVADARAAGLIGAQGEPGTVDMAFQPHRNASDVRAEYWVTGTQQQSAHVNATSVLRDASGYNRNSAPTNLMSPTTHRAFDNFWKAWARGQPRSRRTCTVAEMRQVMHAAIDQIPNFTPGQRGALAWQFELELHALGLQDTNVVRIPYSD